MFKTALKVIGVDIVLLAAEFYVMQDLQWRSSYAAGTLRYSSSFSYSVLTQFFTMTSNTLRLTSPPTLDWVQTLAYAFVVVNIWFAYVAVKSRRSRPPKVAPAQVD
jgi:hypothetical protein